MKYIKLQISKLKFDITTSPFVAKSQPKIRKKKLDISRKHEKLYILYKHEKLSIQNVEFTGNFELSDDILNLCILYQIFRYFFQDDLIEYIVYETFIYCVKINPNKHFKIISKT
jgi:hypothetical protein